MMTEQHRENLIRRLVSQVAQFRNPGFDLEDMQQEARIALLRAEPNFDPSKGKWECFAALVIRRWLLSRRDVHRGKAAWLRSIVSLDTPLDDPEHFFLMDTLVSDRPEGIDPGEIALENVIRSDFDAKLEQLLSPLEREVTLAWIATGQSLNGAIAITGLTKKKIDNTLERVKRKLRKHRGEFVSIGLLEAEETDAGTASLDV